MSFKTLDLSKDVASIVSAINEVFVVSSSLFANDLNVKKYNNIASSSADQLGGYWQTVYDSSPSSSLSTPLFDVTYGYSSLSPYNVPATLTSSQDEKIKVYRSMASTLLGDPDSQFSFNSETQQECFFVLFKRGIQKDEVKKGSTTFIWGSESVWYTGSDTAAVSSYKQALGGDYAPLMSGTTEVGQVWYNAGVIILPDSLWSTETAFSGSFGTIVSAEQSGTIDNLVDGFRNHVDSLSINNQTNLYSSIFFCRATNSEFNYSSNPTFTDDNMRIRVTSGSNVLQTRTYVTTIGLYDANDNLLAVAKVNKPITKSPDSEAIFRVRLDY